MGEADLVALTTAFDPERTTHFVMASLMSWHRVRSK
jgi:hypothetical protein